MRVIGAAIWLATVSLTRRLRAEVSRFVLVFAGAGVGTLSGVLSRCSARLVRPIRRRHRVDSCLCPGSPFLCESLRQSKQN